MKKEEMRFFNMSDGNIAFGACKEIQAGSRVFYEITGAYFVRKAIEGERFWDQDRQVHNALEINHNIRPFSPVGGFVQTCRFPESKVLNEILNMPSIVVSSLYSMISQELRNAEMKKKMLTRPVPARSGMQPEDAISLVAKYVEKHGHLPQEGTAKAMSVDANSVSVGRFDIGEESPYRQKAKELQEVGS